MKIKAACIGTPEGVATALSSTPFASAALKSVVGEALGAKDVLSRPAEYYVQLADEGPAPQEGMMGVEVRLSGVSRNGRTAKQFHTALKELERIVESVVEQALEYGKKCQIFCVIMIDGEVETAPGSGSFSNNLESSAKWVHGAKQS